MIHKQCALCGHDFEAIKGNEKYCSDTCRIKARKEKHREWVIKTDYNAKKRHAMELYRAKQTEEEYQKQRKKERNRIKALKRKHTIERNKREQELYDRASNGDLLARLSIVEKQGYGYYSAEYWQAFRDYCLDSDVDLFETVVNGISTREDDFVELVLSSMASCKRLVTRTIFHRK